MLDATKFNAGDRRSEGFEAVFLRVEALGKTHIICVWANIERRARVYLSTFLSHHLGGGFRIELADADLLLVPLGREEAKAIHERFLAGFQHPECDREAAVHAFFDEMCHKGHAHRV